MRNILALVGAAVIAFLALGWYLGWYQISNKPATGGKQGVQVDFNADKIQTDVKKGVEKGGEIVDQLREKKVDPQPTPGPATNFFTPTSTDKTKDNAGGGWKPIAEPAKPETSTFGFRLPKN
jgi:hypothetical protein